VRKPKRDEWVRVHPEFAPMFRFYIDSTNRDTTYLVRPRLVPLFRPGALSICTLRMLLNSVGVHFIWLLKHASGKGGEKWAESRFQVVNEAIREWRSIRSGDSCWLCGPPERPDVFPTELRWPQGKFNEWIHKAFPGTRVISDKDHPIIRYQSGLIASPTGL
jgi:hypothetical protein